MSRTVISRPPAPSHGIPCRLFMHSFLMQASLQCKAHSYAPLATFSTVLSPSIGPLPEPSGFAPPPEAFMPSNASPDSGSGGAAALLLRSTPDAVGFCIARGVVSCVGPARGTCKEGDAYLVLAALAVDDVVACLNGIIAGAGTVAGHDVERLVEGELV